MPSSFSACLYQNMNYQVQSTRSGSFVSLTVMAELLIHSVLREDTTIHRRTKKQSWQLWGGSKIPSEVVPSVKRPVDSRGEGPR